VARPRLVRAIVKDLVFVNKLLVPTPHYITISQPRTAGAVAHTPQPGVGKLVNSGGARKTPQERGEDPLPI
jgi:hypothetical protein